MNYRVLPPEGPIAVSAFTEARVALVGFEAEESLSVSWFLSSLGSLARCVEPQLPSLAGEIDSYSAVILKLSRRASSPGTSWVSEPELLALKAPVLVIGTTEELIPLKGIHANGGELLSLPLAPDELLIRVRRFVARSSTPRERVPKRRQRVVIADDDASVLALTGAILRGRGFDCHEATDGQQALEMARTLLPDLLILDLNMPFVNGFEILAALRNEPGTAAMTILLFTAAGSQEDVTRAIELGASSYLCKPFRPFDFLQRVKHLLPAAQKT